MKKHYVEFYYPGIFFSENSIRPIESLKAFRPQDAPATCFGYRFFNREEVKKGRETLIGEKRYKKGTNYFGRIMNEADVEKEVPDSGILRSNMRCNDWPTVVKTRRGNFQPFDPRFDKIVGE